MNMYRRYVYFSQQYNNKKKITTQEYSCVNDDAFKILADDLVLPLL